MSENDDSQFSSARTAIKQLLKPGSFAWYTVAGIILGDIIRQYIQHDFDLFETVTKGMAWAIGFPLMVAIACYILQWGDRFGGNSKR